MTERVKALLLLAHSLSAEERMELLRELATESEADIDLAWVDEALRRCGDADANGTVGVDWESFRVQLQQQ